MMFDLNQDAQPAFSAEAEQFVGSDWLSVRRRWTAIRSANANGVA
jgi:hypothetical protein